MSSITLSHLNRIPREQLHDALVEQPSEEKVCFYWR